MNIDHCVLVRWEKHFSRPIFGAYNPIMWSKR
jgi:hypothetical protein